MCSTAPACAQLIRVDGVGMFFREANLNARARVCFNTDRRAGVHSLVFRVGVRYSLIG